MSIVAVYNNNTDNKRHGNWMQTFTGRQFWPLDPKVEEIFIEDIANSLSKQCRYAGHCREFYSVAEHSVYVSHCVSPELAFCALMHDATEAYVVDVPRPLKPWLKEYKEIEDRVWLAVAERFGLPKDMPHEVHEADTAVLLAEKEQIMGPSPASWALAGTPANVKIQCLTPPEALKFFMERFNELVS
jgi:hypothetical protein